MINQYKTFPGKYVEQMPSLLKKEYNPLSIYDLVVKRLEVLNTAEEDFWWSTDFDTSDGIVYNLDFTFKIFLDADFLKKVDKNTSLVNGSIVLEDLFSSERTFFRNEHIFCRNLDQNESKEHHCWIKILRENTKLLSDYSDAVWSKSSKDDNMGIFIAPPEKVLSGCALHLSQIARQSDIGGDFYLDFKRGLLVGKLN
ncbi:MAG: hypothetical protein AABX39_03715 [Nanoarchaeota archaeon]